jgi:hypothetical protein
LDLSTTCRANFFGVKHLAGPKVDFEELIFPDEIHDFLLRQDWVRAYSASAEFLGRKLGVQEGKPAHGPG